MPRPGFTILACVGALAACGSPQRAAAPSPTGVAPGTYAIEICRAACRGQAADTLLARGRIVIEGAAYPLSTLPPVIRDYLGREHYSLLRNDTVVDPNACFVLERVNNGRTYAGIDRVGVTRVELRDGDVSIDLFHSPDAGYYAVLRNAGGELRGVGTSWGFGVEAGSPRDSVRLRHIGPPDRAPCIRAAEAEAAARDSLRARGRS